MFNLFRISYCLITYLFGVSAPIVSPLSGGSGRVSTFRFCLKLCLDLSHIWQSVIRNKNLDRGQLENKMYRERKDILYSVELLNHSLMRSVIFNSFIDVIFALLFDKRELEWRRDSLLSKELKVR